MPDLVSLIVFTGIIALGLNIVLRKINVHPIIGYILTGSAIATIFDLQAANNNELQTIAELGIAFLLFTIGLEFSINKLRTIKKEVFVYGFLQVALSTLVFYLLCVYLFDLGTIVAFVISSALALSSTAIVLKLLFESRKIYKTHGRNALGVLLFQDLIVIPILLFISLIANTKVNANGEVLQILLNAFILLLIFYILGKYLISAFLHFVSSTKSDELFVTSILVIVLGSAHLAHVLGFNYSLGAFLAGMIISKTHYRYQVESDLVPFRDLLLGVFFITVGMQIKLYLLPEALPLVLGLLVGILIIKALIIYLIIYFFAKNQKIGVKTAIILAQVGEFSFIILEEASEQGLFADEYLSSLVIIVIIFSMVLTPMIFSNLARISRLFVKPESKKAEEEENLKFEPEIEDHVLICGYGGLGQAIVQKLKKLNLPYLVIEKDQNLIKKTVNDTDEVIFGNASKISLLKKVNIQKAQWVIIAISKNEEVEEVTEAIREIDTKIPIIARANNLYQKEQLEKHQVNYIIDEMEATAESMIKMITG
jgi:CPA2 family monovalent cation:H+ antiporter-2